MISKKYADDYRMDTEQDQFGKYRNKMIYTGPLYQWTCSEEELRKTRIGCLLLTIIGWSLFISMLLMNNYFAHLWYIIVPLVCCILSFGYFSVAVFYLFTVKSPFNREMKDKQYDRMKGTATGTLILLLIALIGQLVEVIRFSDMIGSMELLFSVCNLILAVLCIGILRASKQLTYCEVVNPMTQIWADK